MSDTTQTKDPSSEHQKVSRDQKEEAMHDLREDAREHRTVEEIEYRGAAGKWPGEEITRNAIPNADDDPDREALPDDIQRDISRDGVTHDPDQREVLP